MTTLGLNIISGPNESTLLNRCLTSFNAKDNFDEIVIVNTSTDDSIDKVAKKHGAKIFHFNWITDEFPKGNFGGAREFARLNSTTDKIMWLDTDDILLRKHEEKFLEFLSLVKNDEYKDIIIWKFPYSLVYSKDGEPEQFFLRERVFDREKIHWQRAVHEIMFPYFEMVKHATITGSYITHAPIKPQYSSASRNIEILEYEFKKDSNDVQNRYFLGRDYLLGSNPRKGIPLLEGILDELGTGKEMLYAIAIELAWYYSYISCNPRPQIENFQRENILKVESYCRLALAFSFTYAEPYVLLGDVYFFQKDYSAATRMYLTALNKKKDFNSGEKAMFRSLTMVGEIPCNRLSLVYEMRGLLGMSLHYNKQALRHNRIESYIQKRRIIVNKIIEECKLLCQTV